MPSGGLVDRAALAGIFPDPRSLRAFEAVLQQLSDVGSSFSTGDLKPFAGATAPDGWLTCDGSPQSRAIFSDLFGVIGVTWGPGDGSTTFNLPDLRDRVPVGASGAKPLGSTGGASSVTLAVGQLPAHNHAVTDPGHVHAITDPGHLHTAALPAVAAASAGVSADGAAAGNTGSAVTGITINSAATGITTQNTGAGDPVAIEPPYAAVTWLIKT